MDLQENKLRFLVIDQDSQCLIELLEYDTVEMLKIEIHRRLGVPPHKQIIIGWKRSPECDNTVLNVCADVNSVNCLQIKCEADITSVGEDLELGSAINFIKKISNRYEVDPCIHFNTCKLTEAISTACLAGLDQRKILLIYLHNSNDRFSSIFMENLNKPQISEILRRAFFLLCWDVEETKYHPALKEALRNNLSVIADNVNFNIATAFIVAPIKNSVTVLSCFKGAVSDESFLTSLVNAEKFLILENKQERDLQELERDVGNENDMGSVKYQQLMADMLGDRDYDAFEFNQHDLLKKKISFALLGPPLKEEGGGYDEKNMEEVKRLFEIVLKNSNEIAQYKDYVEISFVYNCAEPLPSEKIKRAKKYSNYNPNTDLMPVPIFILRKCHGSDNPCRIFIDHTGRTYKTWDEYKDRNKLHECEMVLPFNGRYEVDRNGNVVLERRLSPACGIDVKILQGADYVSIAGGLLSGGIFLAAAAIPVAPVALAVGGVVGISTGIYSITRSVFTLVDKSRHKEDLSFADSEARGAYINILAGSLGFVGAGANMAVSQLASQGVNIGTGSRAVIDTLAFANIGASGVAVANSSYDVFDRWFNDNQTPSWLTLVQLSSSILFFGNSVYNFRMSSTIIEESQIKTLESYQESLRSNRHRKTFTKMLKQTIRENNFNEVQGRAEVISAIRNIQNKDEVFAVLTRANKEMNRRGVKISASGGEIVLNGVQINYNEFASMTKKEATSFLADVSKSRPTSVETGNNRVIVSEIFTNLSLSDIDMLANVSKLLLHFCSGDIKTKIMTILARLLGKLTLSIREELDRIFPNHSKYIQLINMIVGFIARKAEELEEQYKKWIDSKCDDRYFHPVFKYVNIEKTLRATRFFEEAVNMYFRGTDVIEEELRKLLEYFQKWLVGKIYEHQQDIDRIEERRIHSAASPARKVRCNDCEGYYYQRIN